MTAPTPARRGRPPTPGGAATSAERSAKSRARRKIATVELDVATMEMVDELARYLDLSSRVAVVRAAIWALAQRR